jgi:hypothetical protein
MRSNLLSVVQEASRARILSLPVTKRLHEFLEFRAALDFEEHFVVRICNFDVEMFVWPGGVTTAAGAVGAALACIGHCIYNGVGFGGGKRSSICGKDLKIARGVSSV